MTTLEFLKTILPHEGVYLLAIKTDKGMRHKGFYSLQDMALEAKVLDKKGLSVYHACAAYQRLPYKDEDGKFITRKSVNWLSAKAFWLDIDCGEDKAKEGKGYATQNEGILAIAKWCKQRGFPLPMLINSGRGIHCYWVLTEELPPKTWVETASALKHVLQVDGVLVDPSRTADFASVLRPVGTYNRKNPDDPKEVMVVRDAKPVDTTLFLSLVMQAVTDSGTSLPPVPDWMKADGEQEAIPHTSVPSHAALVADKCKQVAMMRDTGGDVSYDHWRGVIGIIKHCEEGVELAHEWSKRRGETGHNNLDVDTRYNTWTSGPTTCAFFEGCNPEGCKDCPHRGKIKTPLVLGRVEPQQQEEKVEVELPSSEGGTTKVTMTIPEPPPGYLWDGSYLVRVMPDKNGVLESHPFCATRLYLTTRIREADDKLSFVARAHFPRNVIREFRIPGAVIGGGGSELTKFLGTYEVFTTNAKDAPQNMQAYLKDYVKKLTQEADEVTTHTAFGWTTSHDFLIGDTLYCTDGTTKEVLLSGTAEKVRGAFEPPTGTLEGYTEPLNWVYNREGMQPMQYMICSLWASPLVEFCDPTYNGIPCAMTGAQSGKGKSTAALVGLFAYGRAHPDLVIAGDKGATIRAQSAFLGALSNLPMLFDEVTNMDADAMSELCYSLSNGVDRMRLKASSGAVTMSAREYWRAQVAMTGNTCITDLLMAKRNSQAEALRVFEIRVDEYDIPKLSAIDVSNAVSKMAENQGIAGRMIIQYLVTHQKEVRALLAETLEEVSNEGEVSTEPRYRFFRNHIGCTLTMAKIAHQLGVCKFNYEDLKAFALSLLKRALAESESADAQDPLETLSDMILDLSPRIITTETYDLAPGQAPYIVNCPQGVVGRRIVSNGANKDAVYDNKLMLVPSAVREWCLEKRVDYRYFMRVLKASGALVDFSARVYLGKATTITTTQQRAWIIDLTKV